MHVMVPGIVRGQMLQGVPGQCVAAMVVNGFQGGTGEEPHPLPGIHSCGFERNTGTKGVEQEAFKGMVVQGTVGVWDVQTMMTGVKRSLR